MNKIYNKKEEGIASVVGTIFALMIFTALLGMFMTQVVPVTMKENEAQHDIEVLSQLAQMRSMIDILTMTKDTNYTAYAPIKLGAVGIPFFASPTYGQLSLYPSQQSPNYQMDMKFTDKFGNIIYRNSTGSLQFIAPNKYYVPEVFEYANGALIRYNYLSKSGIFSINPNIKFENVALGYALNFTGKNYVTVPSSDSLNITGPISLEAWLYIRGNGITQPIIYKNSNYELEITSNNNIKFGDTNGDYVETAALPSNDFNRWIHVAAVFSGEKGDAVSPTYAQIYIDGNTAGATWSNTSWNPASSTSSLYMGDGYKGILDEVRILNRALTANEIESDYVAGFHYPTRYDTVAWYHFDEGNGTLVADSSGNGNNGTATNPDWVPITGVNVATTLQNIFGNPDSVTGTETRSISISLEGESQQTYNIGGTLNITMNDYYPFSKSFAFNFTKYWISYLTNSLNSTGLKEGFDYKVIGDTITIYTVESATVNMVYLSMEIER